MKYLLITGLSVALAGCATTAAPGATAVTVTSSQSAAQGCKALGQASVTAHSMPVNITRENAITQMRNKVVEMGGNLVVSSGPQVAMPGPVATMNGDVYAC